MDTLIFNNSPSYIMHIDINSCFATIEQQANPFLRGKPIVVAAYTTIRGCILAASIESKKLGIKTGMMVGDARKIHPKLIVLSPDPDKYRFVHKKLYKLLTDYSPEVIPKSIDEFVLTAPFKEPPLKVVAQEIKSRIKKEIGEWLTVSIGISTNKYLAKIAAGLHKPDGLDEINSKNFLNIYSTLKLTDLTGIKEGNASRLNSVGIYSVLDFYEAPVWKLKAAFHSINGLYWHTRLSGYEADSIEFGRRSYGNSTALGATIVTKEEVSPILSNLVEKTGARMRAAGYMARGVHVFMSYKNGSFWHHGELAARDIFDSRDIFRLALKIISNQPFKTPVKNIAISVFDLKKAGSLQLDFFENVERKEIIMQAVDKVNERFGDFVIKPGRMLLGKQKVLDRIAFGGIKN